LRNQNVRLQFGKASTKDKRQDALYPAVDTTRIVKHRFRRLTQITQIKKSNL
jgi:hypothetical protein